MANQPPVCSAAQVSPAVLWAPNHQFVPIAIIGVTDPDEDSVTITVTDVTQDEPVKGKGDGNTSPDALIQARTASVRAERSGSGNGRVYHILLRPTMVTAVPVVARSRSACPIARRRG